MSTDELIIDIPVRSRGRPKGAKTGRNKRGGHVYTFRISSLMLDEVQKWVDTHHAMYSSRPAYKKLEYADLIRVAINEFLMARLPQNNFIAIK